MPNPLARHRSRIAALLAAALAASASACASLKGVDAPDCDGPRRPANPHGSVLEPGVPTAAGAGAPASPCKRTAP